MIYIIFTCLIFLLILTPIILGIYSGYRLIHPRKVPEQETLKIEFEKGEIPKDFFSKAKTEFSLDSPNGYKIAGMYFRGEEKKTVILCHGISWTKLGVAKYLDYFFQNNWNIVLYDHRGSGESGGKYPSFGYYEKLDLDLVWNFTKTKFPDSKIMGLFGESMGGATILQYSKMNPNIDFLIALCPFLSMKSLILFQMQVFKIPKFLAPIIFYITNLITKSLVKFSIYDVNPGLDVMESKSPLFLSHGKKDKVVSYSMNEDLYFKRKELAKTIFYSSEYSGHTPSLYIDNKSEFDSIMKKFLEDIKI